MHTAEKDKEKIGDERFRSAKDTGLSSESEWDDSRSEVKGVNASDVLVALDPPEVPHRLVEDALVESCFCRDRRTLKRDAIDAVLALAWPVTVEERQVAHLHSHSIFEWVRYRTNKQKVKHIIKQTNMPVLGLRLNTRHRPWQSNAVML
jgi:hypothetical protein